MSRRVIALVVLGAVVLGGAVFFLTRGGDANDPAPTQVASPSQNVQPGTEPEEVAVEEEERKRPPRPPRTDFVPSGRDPFVPLVQDVGTTAAGTTSATTAPTTDPTAPATDPTTAPTTE